MTTEEIVRLAEYYEQSSEEELGKSFERRGLTDLYERYMTGDTSVMPEVFTRLRKLES